MAVNFIGVVDLHFLAAQHIVITRFMQGVVCHPVEQMGNRINRELPEHRYIQIPVLQIGERRDHGVVAELG